MNFWRTFKFYLIKLKRLQGNPQALAGGTAIGVLIGLTPTMPFHTLLIFFLTLISRTSTIAGIIVSWIVCNPLTYLPIYYLSAVIGNRVTPYTLNVRRVQQTLEQIIASAGIKESVSILLDSGFEAIAVMVAGGFLMALPVAVISYYFSLRFFVHIQQRRLKKHVLE